MDDQAARSTALIELATLQQTTYAHFPGTFQHGLEISDEAFQQYLDLARRLLAETVAYEQRWPGSFELQGYAQPLIQQLSMYADFREAAGDRSTAGALRAEADQLTAAYLGPVAAASVERGRAMEDADAGRFHDALIRLDRVHRTFLAADDPIDAAQTLVQLANVYEWLCDYARALTTLDAARELVATDLRHGPPSTGSVAAALGKQILGVLSGRTGTEGEDALGLRRVYFEVVQAQARVNRQLGHYEEARRLFEEARPFVESYVGAGVDFHLAATALAQGELDEADRLLSSVEPEFTRRLLRPRLGALRQLQADLLLARDRPVEALRRAEDGLADQAKFPDLDLAWKLHWRRARALSALDRPEDAIAAYRSAAEAADTLRMAPLGYVLDTSFLRDKLPMFDAAIGEAVARKDAVSAVWFVELVKARALSAVLSLPHRPRDGESEDIARFDEVSLRLDAIAFSMYDGSATAADVHEREQLLYTRTELLERIRIHDPRWRAMTQPVPVDVLSLSRLAGRDRNVLVLYQRGNRIVSALLGAGGTTVGEITCTDQTIAALAEYVENLHKAQPDWFLSDLSGELGVSLTDLVPEAITRSLLEPGTLLVVPHASLHLLPWSTMTLDGKRLFESAAVGVLPNLAALSQLDADFSPPRSVALLGDPDYTGLQRYRPLPEAGPELAEVAELYGERGLVAPPLTGPDATQGALLALMSGPGAEESVLHVASHGDLDAAEPLTSGLILTGSKLDAAEIIQHRCGYPEVVLSACSTGWRPQSAHGTELAGDDALGLTASFLEAGARSLLVSIPQAKDDIARAFAVGWHRHRRAGATPLNAYRNVQLQMHAADPGAVWSWAGITLYGCR